jgi:hypothetical protein
MQRLLVRIVMWNPVHGMVPFTPGQVLENFVARELLGIGTVGLLLLINSLALKCLHVRSSPSSVC